MINEFRGMRDMDEEEGEEEAVDVFIQKWGALDQVAAILIHTLAIEDLDQLRRRCPLHCSASAVKNAVDPFFPGNLILYRPPMERLLTVV